MAQEWTTSLLRQILSTAVADCSRVIPSTRTRCTICIARDLHRYVPCSPTRVSTRIRLHAHLEKMRTWNFQITPRYHIVLRTKWVRDGSGLPIFFHPICQAHTICLRLHTRTHLPQLRLRQTAWPSTPPRWWRFPATPPCSARFRGCAPVLELPGSG